MPDDNGVVKKLRIVQRPDGLIFTWTPDLDAMSQMRPGWLTVYADGRQEVTLDVGRTQDLDTRTISQREQALIEKVAHLSNQLARAEGLVPLQEHETPLPDKESPTVSGHGLIGSIAEIVNLTEPGPLQEEPITFAEREFLAPSTLKTMRKADLASHARSFDMTLSPAPELAEEMLKDDLVTLCLDLQQKAVGES